MSFTPQQNLANYVGGVGVFDYSSPASVVFRNKLFLFYLGSGKDGIFVTTTSDGTTWTAIKNIRDEATHMNVAANTSPCPVVYQDAIYLFFNGIGNDGTWCTIYNGSQWSQVFSISDKVGGMGFLPSTSPAAAIYQSKLYLFWNGSGDDGIWFTAFDGTNWAHPDNIKNIGIAKATSPFAVSFNGSLYLFWNGRGDDGTWYSSQTNGSWAPGISVKAQIDFMGFLTYTSPTALVLGDGYTMRLFWVGSGGSAQGLWYSDFNTKTWSKQNNMANDIGGQGLLPSTSPCAIDFQLTPYVFWVGYGKDLWFSSGITYDLSSADWFGPNECFRLGKSFTLTSRDLPLISFFNAKFGGGMSIPPSPPAETTSALVARVFEDWKVAYKSFVDKVTFFAYLVTTRAVTTYLVIIHINIQVPPNMPGLFIQFLRIAPNM